MNKIFKLVWSAVRQAWTVTHEKSRSTGRGARSARTRRQGGATRVAAAFLTGSMLPQAGFAAPPAPNALPTGGQVVAGQAAITQSGAAMNIAQSSERAILNWNTFNIGANASVNFQQPGATSVALNRVLSADPSRIYGSLTANGQVFLVSPSGVLFGPGARVDVGGLVASTLNIRNEDFMAGNYRFTRDGATGSVINQGSIVAQYAALLAPEVINEGVIAARMGTAALAAGDAVTLGIAGHRLASVVVDRASIDTLVENRHLVQVDGGTVVMSAQSADTLLGRTVNTGSIEADGVTTDGGVVRLRASSSIDHSGTISADAGANDKGGEVTLIADLSNRSSRTVVSGSISARGGSASGDGGFVETSASRLTITDSARIDTSAANGQTGQWLLDPYDFTVAASGGDMTGTALSSALAISNVSIETSATSAICDGASCTPLSTTGEGDIHINDTVTWTSDKTLTLSAWRDININGTININADNSNAGAAGTLELHYGQRDVADTFSNDARITVTGKVNLGDNTAYKTLYGNDGTLKNYTIIRTLPNLIDVKNDLGLDPTFSGNEKGYALGADIVISSGTWTPLGDGTTLDVNNVSTFFGILDGLGHSISGISRPNTDNANNIGLFGTIDQGGIVRNLGVSGDVAGLKTVGLLAGQNMGSIHNVWTSGTVTGSDVGAEPGTGLNTGTSDSIVSGIGGLVGWNLGSITRSRSSATVTALSGDQSLPDDPLNPGNPAPNGLGQRGGIGGLVGIHMVNTLSDSYATGEVKGLLDVGGLIGHDAGNVINTYASGKVNDAVSGATNAGGLVGALTVGGPTVVNSFWNTDTSLQSTSSGGGTGLTTAQMQTAANFTSATADNGMVNPQWNAIETMPSVFTPRVNWKLVDGASPRFVDSTDFTPGGPTSSTITINLANTSRTYGETTRPDLLTGYSLTGSLLSGDALTVDWGSALTDTLGAGTYLYGSTTNLVTPDFTFGSGHSLSNYTINWSNTGLTVHKKAVTLTATKTYDGITDIAANQLTVATGVGTETLGFTLGGTLTSNSKNVFDANKYLTNPGVITLTAGGANPGDPGNYTVPAAVHSAANTVTITKKTLAITAPDTSQMPGVPFGNSFDQSVRSGVVKKYYDGSDTGYAITINQAIGTSASTGPGTTGDGLKYAGDDVSVSSATATTIFSGGTVAANAGTGKTVTLNAALSGSEAGNYQLGLTLPGEIVKRPVKLEATKVYDGTTDLTGLVTVTTGVGGQEVTLTGNPVAANKNVLELSTTTHITGTGLGLAAVSGTGADADNYQLPPLTHSVPGGFNVATITPKTVTLAATKTYDGTTTILQSQLGVTTGVTGESFSIASLTGPATSTKQNVSENASNFIDSGNAITFAAGANTTASNYVLPTTLAGTVPVTIAPKAVALSANKTYDGSTVLTADQISVATDVGTETLGVSIASGNTVNASSKDVFATNKYIANPGTITLTASGDNPGNVDNYTLPAAAHSAANTVTITKKTLLIQPSAAPAQLGSAGITGLQGPGLFTVEKYYDGQAASSATVTLVSAFATPQERDSLLSGGSLTGPSTANDGSYYNGENPIGSLPMGGVTATVTFSGDANAGARTVTLVPNFTLSGPNAGNYQLQTTAPARILPRPVVLTASKTYDGNTTLGTGATVSIGNVLNGEALSFSDTPVAANANVSANGGNYITALDSNSDSLTLLAGADTLASNYLLPSLTAHSAQNSVTINQKTVTLSATKTYDATTNLGSSSDATPLVTITTGVGSETLRYNGAMAFSKNVYDAAGASTAYNYVNAITLQNGTGANAGSVGNYRLPDLTQRSASNQVTIDPKVLDFKPDSAVLDFVQSPYRSFVDTVITGTTVVLVPSTDKSAPGALRSITGPTLRDKVAPGNATAFAPYTGDSVTLTGTPTVNAQGISNSATRAEVTITGLSLDGADKDNYTLTGASGKSVSVRIDVSRLPGASPSASPLPPVVVLITQEIAGISASSLLESNTQTAAALRSALASFTSRSVDAAGLRVLITAIIDSVTGQRIVVDENSPLNSGS